MKKKQMILFCTMIFLFVGCAQSPRTKSEPSIVLPEQWESYVVVEEQRLRFVPDAIDTSVPIKVVDARRQVQPTDYTIEESQDMVSMLEGMLVSNVVEPGEPKVGSSELHIWGTLKMKATSKGILHFILSVEHSGDVRWTFYDASDITQGAIWGTIPQEDAQTLWDFVDELKRQEKTN